MISNTPSTVAQRTRRLTLELPGSLVQDLIRLAELRGCPFDREVAEDFAFLLTLSGGPRPGTMLEHFFELERRNEPTERVSIVLPLPLFLALGTLARGYGVTRGRALAAVLIRGVRCLLQAQTIRVERNLPFAEAYLSLLAA